MCPGSSTGTGAVALLQRDERLLGEIAGLVGSPGDATGGVQRKLDELRAVAEENKQLRARLARAQASELADAAVDGAYTWLGIAIVVGSILSLGYYLRVVAAMWMCRYEIELPSVPARRVKPVSGWSPEADTRAQPEVAAVAIVCAVLTVLFGLWPEPLFDAARDVGTALSQLRR